MPLVDVVRKNGADVFPQMSSITIGRGPHTNVGFAVRVTNSKSRIMPDAVIMANAPNSDFT